MHDFIMLEKVIIFGIAELPHNRKYLHFQSLEVDLSQDQANQHIAQDNYTLLFRL